MAIRRVPGCLGRGGPCPQGGRGHRLSVPAAAGPTRRSWKMQLTAFSPGTPRSLWLGSCLRQGPRGARPPCQGQRGQGALPPCGACGPGPGCVLSLWACSSPRVPPREGLVPRRGQKAAPLLAGTALGAGLTALVASGSPACKPLCSPGVRGFQPTSEGVMGLLATLDWRLCPWRARGHGPAPQLPSPEGESPAFGLWGGDGGQRRSRPWEGWPSLPSLAGRQV